MNLLLEDANWGRLFTKHDRWNVHKTLGIMNLAHFLYRYAWVYPRSGNLGMNRGGILEWGGMAIGAALPTAALQFHTPTKRIPNQALIIYKEYLLHALLFSLRQVNGFLLKDSWYAPHSVMVHHFLVDAVSSKFGVPGNTAVRTTATTLKQNPLYRRLAMAYSFYQFLAMASLLRPAKGAAADNAFNGLIAIQSSAFLMTLYRKRIIRRKTHMIGYSLCLVLSAFHFLRTMRRHTLANALLTFIARVSLPKPWNNKYLLWSLFFTQEYLIDTETQSAS